MQLLKAHKLGQDKHVADMVLGLASGVRSWYRVRRNTAPVLDMCTAVVLYYYMSFKSMGIITGIDNETR